MLADCDDGIRILCDLIGWRDELESLISRSTGQPVNTAAVNLVSADRLQFSQRGTYRHFYYVPDENYGDNGEIEEEDDNWAERYANGEED